MKSCIRTIIIFLCIIFLAGVATCRYWYRAFAYEEQIQDYYYLIAVDDEKYMDISYNNGGGTFSVIPSTVFAVGYNENFIIAKQHPCYFAEPIDKTITHYYIIPIKNNPNNNAIGPLTLEQFYEKRKELNVPDSVKFTKEFEKLK
jgi:hypothetical protein